MDWIREHRRALLAGAAALMAALLLRSVLGALIGLCVGGAALAFVLLPLVKLLERRMKRSTAIFAAFGCVAALLMGALIMLAPVIAEQAQRLMRSLPALSASISGFTHRLSAAISSQLGGEAGAPAAGRLSAQLEQLPSQVASALGALLGGTANMAGSIADGVGRFSLMLILGYYFLKDRERMLMQLELMLPSALRARTIALCGALQRELSGYVRGQLLISLIVGAITAVGLAILRVPSFLVLGLIMTVFNLIPYFGALLGAIPIVLLTLSMGWVKVLEVGIMLLVAQQIENMVIAPRVTGRTTGLHPVAVILALTAGGYLGGVMGMVFAIPGAIVLRGVVRELVMRGDAREDALMNMDDAGEHARTGGIARASVRGGRQER